VFQDEDLLNYVAVGDIHPNALGKIRDRKEDLKRIEIHREYKKRYRDNKNKGTERIQIGGNKENISRDSDRIQIEVQREYK